MSTPSTVQSQVPDAGTPIFDQNGYINTVWHQFFFMLLRRTGGTIGIDAGSESARITVVEDRIEDSEQVQASMVQVRQKAPSIPLDVTGLLVSRKLEELQMVQAHGLQNDPVLHTVATQALSGFMSSADKTKLDGVANNATAVTILGTVSQSGGTPTGSVIQSYIAAGSGYRVTLWADGRAEVTGALPTVAVAANSTTTVGITFPSGLFVGAVLLLASTFPSVTVDFYGANYYNSNSTSGAVGIRNGATAQNAGGNFIAIGRWF